MVNSDYRPLDSIPDELVADILLRSRKHIDFVDNTSVRHMLPARAMLVAKRWNRTICDTPEFWIDIPVTTATAPEVVTMHLNRSGTYPVYIWLERGAVTNRPVLDILQLHAQRCGGLFVETQSRELGRMVSSTVTVLKGADVDIAQWITITAPYVRDVHIGGLSVHPRDNQEIGISCPSLRCLSYSSTSPRFQMQDSPNLAALRYHGCLVSLSSVVRQIEATRWSLESICIQDGMMRDTARRLEIWESIESPVLREIMIRSRTYEGFGADLLANVACPSLRSLTYASASDQWENWSPMPLNFPALEVLNLDEGHPVPGTVLSEILRGSPNIKQLLLPRLKLAGNIASVVAALVGYGSTMSRELRDLRVYDFSAAQLKQVVEALPSIKRLDLSAAPWDSYENPSSFDDVQWLKQNVDVIDGYWWNG